MPTYYEILGIKRRASRSLVDAAYATLLHELNVASLNNAGPFRRAQQEQRQRDVQSAYNTLQDPVLRAAYDATLPPPEEFDFEDLYSDHTPDGSGPEDDNYSSYGADYGAYDSNAEDEKGVRAGKQPATKEAVYRYMATETGTEIQILISGWHIDINLSTKFKLLDDFTEHSKRNPNDNNVSFEFGLKRHHSSPEAKDPNFNEFTVKVRDISFHMRVKNLSTYYREIGSTSILQVTVESEPLSLLSPQREWDFGFDIDLLPPSVRDVDKHATHIMFTREEPPEHYKLPIDVRSVPDFKLKRDKDLRADRFLNLGSDRCMKIKYGKWEMWRLVAVACKCGTAAGDGRYSWRYI